MAGNELNGGELGGQDVARQTGQSESGNASVRQFDRAQNAGSRGRRGDEPKQTYIVRDDAPPTLIEGKRAEPGMRVELTIAQARAAAGWLVTEDGQSIPHERQVVDEDVPRAALAGLARHERVDALRQEEERLQRRLDVVRTQITNEEAESERMRAEFEGRQQATDQRGQASDQPGPAVSNVSGPHRESFSAGSAQAGSVPEA